MKKLVLLVFTCFSVSFTWAQDSYIISYSEQELTTTQGRAKVLRRIQDAATSYCPTYLQIKSHSDVRACVEGVVQDLLDKIDSAELHQLAQGASPSAQEPALARH